MKKVAYGIFLFAVMVTAAFADTITVSPELISKPGRKIANGEIPTPADVALDAYAAEAVQKRSAPEGFITIFGSARSKEGMAQYDLTRAFAKLWSEKHGDRFPVLTGGGRGAMEAGNRGAKEAGKKSIYFSAYFGNGNEPMNKYVTDGYVFASFAQREADLVDRGAAIVCAQGGFGTEWEIYESLSKIQTGKKKRVPVILLGSKADWATLIARIEYFVSIKTIAPDDINLIQIAETPEKAVELIEKALIPAK